jgi:hypothetical protein
VKLSQELYSEFQNLACRLSPENLTCDGECSQAESNRKYRTLTNRWKELEKQVGRKVSENELYSDLYSDYRGW